MLKLFIRHIFSSLSIINIEVIQQCFIAVLCLQACISQKCFFIKRATASVGYACRGGGEDGTLFVLGLII